MGTTIGSLNYLISANTSGFTKGILAARGELAATKRIMAETMTPAQQLGTQIDTLRNLFHKELITLDQYNEMVERVKNNTPEMIAQQEKLAAVMSRGANTTQAMLTPVERYDQRIAELGEELQAGAIDQATFNRAVSAADRELKAAGISLQTVGNNMRSIGTTMSIGVTAPILAAGAASLKAASDAAEGQSKFEVVFSSVSSAANEMAATLDADYGLSSAASKRLLTDTADLLTGFGFTQQQALELSGQVQTLAVDLASFTNVEGGAERASQALTSGLLGEREAMKALGIAVNENTAEFKSMLANVEATTGLTGTQAKAIATLRLATEQSKNAIGDYARTQDSLANQTREVAALSNDLAVQFGNILVPAAADLLGLVKPLIEGVAGLSDEWKTGIVVTAGVAAAIGPVVLITGQAITATHGLMAAYTALKTSQIALSASTIATTASVAGFAAAAAGAVYVGWQLGESIANLDANVASANRVIGELRDQAAAMANVEFTGVDETATQRFIDQTQQRIQKTKEHIAELEEAQAWWNAGLANADLIETEKLAIDKMNDSLNAANRHLSDLKREAATVQPPAIVDAAGMAAADEAAQKYLDSLREQQATLGMTAEQAERYKLAMEGVSEEMLGVVDAAQQEFAAAQRNQDAIAEQRRQAEELTKSIEDYTAAARDQAVTMGMAAGDADLFRFAQAGATDEQLAAARAANEARNRMADWTKMMQDGAKLTEQFQSPAERATAELQRLGEMFALKAIDQETYAAAVKATRDQLRGKLTAEFETRGLDAAVKGSREYAEAIAAQRDAQNRANADTVQAAQAQAAANRGQPVAQALADRRDPVAAEQAANRDVLERIAAILEEIEAKTEPAEPIEVEEVTL